MVKILGGFLATVRIGKAVHQDEGNGIQHGGRQLHTWPLPARR